MKLKKIGLSLAIIASVLFWGGAPANASEITDLYMKALQKNDQASMNGIIKYKKDAIPGEIQGLIEKAQAPEATAEEKESFFYVAEHMAIRYKDVTGDFAPLIEVKKRSFDSRLSAPVTPEMTDGARIINIPMSSEHVKNIFEPDNIVVNLGDTVRWTNSDKIAHVFATMSAISAGRFSVSSIAPGESWEYKFEKPGEYFYICFIHQSMIGKITVKDPSKAAPEAGAAPAPAPATPAAATESSTAPAPPVVSATPDTPAAPAITPTPAETATPEAGAAPAPAEPAAAEGSAPAPPKILTVE